MTHTIYYTDHTITVGFALLGDRAMPLFRGDRAMPLFRKPHSKDARSSHLSHGSVLVPGTIPEDEQLEYARAAYDYYGDRYDGCDWPGIGEHASHFCL